MHLTDLKSLFNITVIAECCSFLTALILLSKRTGIWRLFILLLFLTIVAETTGWYLWNIRGVQNNSWIFNILLLIRVSVFITLLGSAEPLRKARKAVSFAGSFYNAFGVCNLLFFEGPWTYNGITEVVGDIILAVMSCYFFYKVLTEEAFTNLFTYEYYWFANGLLFHSLGSVVLYLFLQPLWQYYKETGVNVYGFINYGINVLLYGSLIVAFICRHRNTRLSQRLSLQS